MIIPPETMVDSGPALLFGWACVHIIGGMSFVIATRANRPLLTIAKGCMAAGFFVGLWLTIEFIEAATNTLCEVWSKSLTKGFLLPITVPFICYWFPCLMLGLIIEARFRKQWALYVRGLLGTDLPGRKRVSVPQKRLSRY